MTGRGGLHGRLGLLLGLLALATAAVAYSRAVRQVSLGREFAYVPRENVLLVATGELEAVWRAGERQLGGYLADPADEGEESFIGQGLVALAEGLEEWGLAIRSFEDIAAHGLDPGRGAIASLFRTKREEEPYLVLVLPVDDPQRLVARVAETLGEDPGAAVFEAAPGAAERFDVIELGEWLLAWPEPGIGVVSNSEELLRRSLFERRLNLESAINDDALYGAMRRVLQRPVLTGSAVFFFWQSRSAPFGELAATLELEDEGIELRADIEIGSGALRLLGEALEPAPEPAPWQRDLPQGTLAALTIQDRHLPRYLDLLLKLGDLEDGPATRVLSRFAGSGGIARASIALTGLRNGLPELALGVWGEREKLEGLRWEIQQALHRARDRAVLGSALAAVGEERPAESVVADLLEREPSAAFGRYPIVDGKVGEADLRPEDLSGEEYRREFRGETIEFLAPPVTANDFEYREELEGADRNLLESDDYRPASVLFEDSLWLATDAQALEGVVLRRLGEAPSLADGWSYRRLRHGSAGDHKAELFFNADGYISSALLDGADADEAELIESLMRQFAGHPALRLEIGPTDWGRRLHLALEVSSGG